MHVYTYIALVISNVDIVIDGNQAVQLVKGLGKFLGVVGRARILEALDQTICAAREETTLGVGSHRVDQGSMGVQRVL